MRMTPLPCHCEFRTGQPNPGSLTARCHYEKRSDAAIPRPVHFVEAIAASQRFPQ
jgi:hypothetical protein